VRAVIVSLNETPGDRGVTRNGLPNADDDPPQQDGRGGEPLLGDAVLDDSFASRVALVGSKSKDERLIERSRRVLEPEAEDLVGVATFERMQCFAELHLRSVEMSAQGREHLFAAVHEREGISMTAHLCRCTSPTTPGHGSLGDFKVESYQDRGMTTRPAEQTRALLED
jgi:hypothetical protein